MMHSHIGELVRVARLHRELSQVTLAGLINTQQSAISELETGLHPPNITTFLRAMNALRFDVEVTIRARDSFTTNVVLRSEYPEEETGADESR